VTLTTHLHLLQQAKKNWSHISTESQGPILGPSSTSLPLHYNKNTNVSPRKITLRVYVYTLLQIECLNRQSLTVICKGTSTFRVRLKVRFMDPATRFDERLSLPKHI
jgi:hypothetical protein